MANFTLSGLLAVELEEPLKVFYLEYRNFILGNIKYILIFWLANINCVECMVNCEVKIDTCIAFEVVVVYGTDGDSELGVLRDLSVVAPSFKIFWNNWKVISNNNILESCPNNASEFVSDEKTQNFNVCFRWKNWKPVKYDGITQVFKFLVENKYIQVALLHPIDILKYYWGPQNIIFARHLSVISKFLKKKKKCWRKHWGLLTFRDHSGVQQTREKICSVLFSIAIRKNSIPCKYNWQH